MVKENNRTGANASLADDIHATLKREILALSIAPRSVLDEAALVKRFGVSRTPVREALRKLEADDLVELRRHQSAQVKPILLETVSDFFECIRIVQKAVLVLSAARSQAHHIDAAQAAETAFEVAVEERDTSALPALNIDFHLALAAGANNVFLADAYQRVLGEGARLSAISFRYRESGDWNERMGGIVEDHRAFLAALGSNDQARIAELSDQHLALFRTNMLSILTRQDTEGLVGDVSEMALAHIGDA